MICKIDYCQSDVYKNSYCVLHSLQGYGKVFDNPIVKHVDTSGYIYIASLGYDNLYKIGRTKNVKRRLKELSAGNIKIKLITAVHVKDYIFAENLLHKKLEKYHTQREIFELSPTKLQSVISTLNLT